MKKTVYLRTEMAISKFDNSDVIATSGILPQNDNQTGSYDLPFVPKQN